MSISHISEKTRYLLWAKSAGRCQFNGCNKLLYRDGLTKIEMNFADVAHIIGDRPGGPRGDETISLDKEYCNNVSNLMIMCKDHHEMIDKIVETYTIEALREMKENHEKRIELLMSIQPDKTSNVVVYRGRVGSVQPAIEFRETLLAMSPDYYPANRFPHELSMPGSMFTDDTPDFWDIQVKNLEMQFNKQVAPLLGNDQERNHYSIFAFAPIPLLIKLGTLLPDKYPAQVYQLTKEPPNWEWQPEPSEFGFTVSRPTENHKIVALNLSLSADIDSQRIIDVLQTEDVSIWRMDVQETIFPKNDHLRGKEQHQSRAWSKYNFAYFSFHSRCLCRRDWQGMV